jgi:hypothetical protein
MDVLFSDVFENPSYQVPGICSTLASGGMKAFRVIHDGRRLPDRMSVANRMPPRAAIQRGLRVPISAERGLRCPMPSVR